MSNNPRNSELFRCRTCGFVSNARGVGVHIATQKHEKSVDRVIGGDWKKIRSDRLANVRNLVVDTVKFDPKMVK